MTTLKPESATISRPIRFSMRILSLWLLLGIVLSVQAQEQTVGVLFGHHTGYTLFTPDTMNTVYLIDDQGRVVHDWTVSGVGRDAFLRPNGDLIVTMTRQHDDPGNFAAEIGFTRIDGRFEQYTWEGDLVWSYEFDRPNYRVHHGIKPMPNGDFLFIAWEYHNSEEAIAAGRDPEHLGERTVV